MRWRGNCKRAAKPSDCKTVNTFSRHLLALVFAALALCVDAQAAENQWTGALSTDFHNNSNWVGGQPGAGDTGVFSSAFGNQPMMSSNRTIGALWMTSGVGQNVIISQTGAQTLTLNAGTVAGIAAMGILIDNPNAFSLTINSQVRLGNAQTWRNSTGNLFTVGGPLDLNNRALTVDGVGNTLIMGVMAGAGALTKAGIGTWTLAGANTHTGIMTINAGAVNVQNASALGATTAGTTVNAGGALQLQGGVVVAGEALSLNGSGTATTGALRNISGNNTYSGAITLAGASTIGSDAGLLTIAGNIAAANFATTFTGAGATTVSGILSGTGSLIKNGSGLLTLSGVNTYNGGTTINSGTVAVSSVANLGATTGGLTINAGTLEVTAGHTTTRSVTLGNLNSTIQVDAGQTFAINSSIGGGGALVKTGPGTLALGGNNQWGGGTFINAGTVLITADNQLGANSSKPTINAGTLEVNGTFSTNRQFTVGSPLSTFQIDAGQALTVNQNISGSGSLNKAGAGTMILGGNNLGYGGSTNIYQGTLQVTRQGRHLPNTTSVNVFGGTLDLQTFDEYVGAVTLYSGSIIGSGPGVITGTSFTMESGLVSAILAGNAALVKNTLGTVTLTGVNTYTGGTIINAGSLAINSASALGAAAAVTTIYAGALELLPNNTVVTNRTFTLGDATSTFQVDAGSTLNLTGVLGNAATPGSLTKTGPGTLILSPAGANTYGGVGQTTSINEGVLQVARDNQLGNASTTLTFGGIGMGTLRIGAPGFTTPRSVILEPGGAIDTNNNDASVTGVVSGSGVFTKTGAGTLTLTGTNTYGGGTSITGGNNSILSISSGANIGTGAVTISNGAVLLTTATMTLPGGINLGTIGGNNQPDGNAVSGIVNVSAGTTLTETAGSIISGGRLMKDGFGTFELLGNNTYSGGTYLHNGTLVVYNANSLGLQPLLADPFSTAITIDNGATLRTANSFVGYPGRGILIGTGGAFFEIDNWLTQFNNGPIANVSGQTGGFTKAGMGIQGLGGTNTFIGDVRVNAGVLSVSRDANFGAAANQIFLTGGTSLRIEDGLNNYGATPGTPVFATFSTSRQFNLGAGFDTIEVKNYADTNPSFGVGGAPARPTPHLNSFTVNGPITGAGTLVKEGDGRLFLSNASNNYTGGTIINAGTLSVNNPTALGLNTTLLTINNQATFQATASFDSSRAILLSSSTAPSPLVGGIIDVTGANNLNQTGIISGDGSLGKTGTGTLTLQGSNTFLGGLFINGGTISARSNASLGALTPSSGSPLYAVHMANGGTLETPFNSIGDFRQLELVSGVSTLDVPTGFTQQRDALVYGAGGFVKAGGGTKILTNANTYTGGTTINGGTLQVNNTTGSGTGTGAVTVNSGGILSGLPASGFLNPGTISGAVTVNNKGLLLARSSATPFTFGSLTLAAGAVTEFQLGAPTLNEVIRLTNANGLTLAGLSTINITSIGGLQAGIYHLFDYNGTALTDISNLQLGSTAGGGLFYSLSNNQTNTSIDLVLSTVDNQWANDASGNWSVPTNWTNNIPPDSVGAQANFLGLINQARTATVDGAYTVGTITFDNLNSYTVGDDGVVGHGLTLSNLGTAAVNVLSGSHFITAPMTLSDDVQVMASAGTSLAIDSRIDESAAGRTLSLIGLGTVSLGGTASNTFTGLTSVASGTLDLNKSPGFDAIGQGGLQIDSAAAVNLLAANQISDAANVTVSGTFNIGPFSDTIASLTGDGSVVTAAGGILTIGSATNASSQFDGLISGGGTIAKGGTGTLTLTNVNTFGGVGQTVGLNAGRLMWNADNNLGDVANSVTFNGGSLVFANSFATARSLLLNGVGTIDTNNNTGTASGVVSGTGSFAKVGTGTLTLSGNNTYSGGTSITGGNASILSVSSAANLGTGGLTLSGGSVLASSGTFNLPNAIALGAVGGNFQADGKQVSGIFNVGAGTTLTQTAGGVVSGARLMKDGLGTLELFGTNTFTNGTYLHNGTLVISNANSLGVPTTLADPWTAALTIDNGATLRFSLAFNSYPGRGVLLGTGGAVFDGDAAITQFLNGPMANVSGQGGGFVKTGLGTLGLGGTNTFAGNVNISAGVLSISRDANLGAATNGVLIGNGATLRIEDGLNNYGATPGAPVLGTFASNRQFNLTGGNDTIEVKNFADTNTSFGLGGAPARPASHLNTFTINGLLTGSGTLVKEGDGKLVLTNGSNNYTGGTIVNAGTLSVNSAAALGLDSTGLAINNNAVFQATASFSSARTVTVGGIGGPAGVGGGMFDVLAGVFETQSGVVQGAGSLSKTGTGTLLLTGTNTYGGGSFLTGGVLQTNTDASLGDSSGNVSITDATLELLGSVQTNRNFNISGTTATVQVNGNATYGINGVVSGTGALTKTGNGTLTLFSANTYTGATTINAGTLGINSAASLGSGVAPVTINSGVLNVVDSMTSARAMVLGSATSTVQVDAGYIFNADGAISGAGQLNKTGAGTLVLGSANTYTGATRVTAGSLVAAAGTGAALAGTSALSVESGATFAFGANNQINNTAAITLAGGTFMTGGFSEGSSSAAGMGALDLTSDSHIDFGNGATGTLAFAVFNPGANFLIVDNWSGTPNMIGTALTDRLIFDADPTANLLQFVFNGWEGAVSFDLGNGFYEVTPFSPVPEINPAFAASLLCAGLGIWVHRRSVRRRKDGTPTGN